MKFFKYLIYFLKIIHHIKYKYFYLNDINFKNIQGIQ